MRLVYSADVFAHIGTLLNETPLDWLHTTARSFAHRDDERYEIVTDAGTIHASWVFDSAPEVFPTFRSPQAPRALVSGTSIRVRADHAVFESNTATHLDPLDEESFAYQLPLSPVEALLESASFGPVSQEDQAPLLRYLRARYPEARITVTHAEWGWVPLGFAPSQTTGPRHILLGAKHGLVKPSAGY